MQNTEILKRIEYLISLANTALTKMPVGVTHVLSSDYLGFKANSLSLISFLYGEKHPYYQMFKASITNSTSNSIQTGISLLSQIKYEVENGWLSTLKGLITAEIFADFLEMADHLLSENYKDAAAVMIGSTLEEHLRQLCQTHNVDTHILNSNGTRVAKKASVINADLKKNNVYGSLVDKQVTAWLAIRNSAAHGKYGEYTKEDVRLMYDGVLNFIAQIK